LLALNRTADDALIFKGSPVRGLRPFLAFRLTLVKVPDPEIETLPNFLTALVIDSIKEASTNPELDLGIPASSEIFTIGCPLFTNYLLSNLHFPCMVDFRSWRILSRSNSIVVKHDIIGAATIGYLPPY
jgi:hypothetical protein